MKNAGVDKKIRENEKEVRLLNFLDVFNLQYLTRDTPTMIVSAPDNKIADCNILEGDVFITPSSEKIDEIGFSAVAKEDIPNAVYSYHIMRLRIYDREYLNPSFLSYLFSSENLRNQIYQKAQGMTRYGLTLPKWKSLLIPIPPMRVQTEIVRILDMFSELISELSAELELRKKQYYYYREKLLTFTKDTADFLPLGEVASIEKGKQLNKEYLTNNGLYPAYNGGMSYSGFTDCYNYNENKIIISQGGASAGFVNFIKQKFYANAHCYVILPNESIVLNKFIYYILKNSENKLMEKQHGAGIPALKLNEIASLLIPIPPIAEQERIVAILDKFDILVNSISEGIPAEINLRQKQYEYYRSALLSFD